MIISLLLFGAVSAQNVTDFQIDKSYSNAYNGSYYSLYLNDQQDSGVTIYKALAEDDDNDAYDGLIHDEGKEYITPDDDMKIDKNSDNTINFTDYDYATHGVSEVINVDDVDYVVVFWAKDSSNVNNADLMAKLNEFNKDNKVQAIAY